MRLHKRQTILAALLLTVSLLALQPTLMLADQHNNGSVSINATGQATPIKKNKGLSPSIATLDLSGSVESEGEGELKFHDLTGSLQIGGANYVLTDGKGESSDHGEVEIHAKTSDGKQKLELNLHGDIQGSNVITFESHESKLSSLYFLSLLGQVNLSTSSSSSGSSSSSANEVTTVTVTVTQNNNVIQTVTQTQNNTVTELVHTNQTVTETVNNTVTETVANSTITFNQTITVANTTITVTSTAANSTATITVANTTVTVTTTATNSTSA